MLKHKDRKLLATIVAMFAVGGVLGCEPPVHLPPTVPIGPADLGDPSYIGAESVDNVYYFGDSLGAMSREIERSHYVAQAPMVTKWDNSMIPGLRFQSWWPAMNNLPVGSTVVIELGWNNILNEAINTGTLQTNLIGTLNLLREQGVTRAIWFSINTASADLLGSPTSQRIHWMNARMAELVASGAYDDIGLEIYPWSDIAGPYGMELLSDDKLHHNALGTEVFGCALYEAVMGPACMDEVLP